MKYPLQMGCTKSRAAQLGIDAIVNARGGRPDLNDYDQDGIELKRDADGIRRWRQERIRWYGPHSRFFRRHKAKIAHCIARYDD